MNLTCSGFEGNSFRLKPLLFDFSPRSLGFDPDSGQEKAGLISLRTKPSRAKTLKFGSKPHQVQEKPSRETVQPELGTLHPSRETLRPSRETLSPSRETPIPRTTSLRPIRKTVTLPRETLRSGRYALHGLPDDLPSDSTALFSAQTSTFKHCCLSRNSRFLSPALCHACSHPSVPGSASLALASCSSGVFRPCWRAWYCA